jgi:P-type Cu+ transporter
MAGTGLGAEKGILFKNSEALESATKLKTIVLDKTGTLTRGKPTVVDLVPLDGLKSEEELLALGASVEKGSEHPLGRAILKEAESRGLPLAEPMEFRALGGQGVQGRVDDHWVYVGRPHWFEGLGVDLSDREDQILALQGEGKTVIVVAQERRPLGLIALADTLKPESTEAVRQLHEMGLAVVMLTGDNVQTARAIASQVRIDQVEAEVRPEEKASRVKALQSGGNRVGMVGDGINDAPALAQADIGIAIGTGTDVAMETADVILARGDLTGVPRAIRLSRVTMRTIRQNLFWAFFYNIMLIPLAAGVFSPLEFLPEFLRHLNPMLAAFAMAMSSVTVVTNSLRLHRSKID